MKTLIKKIFGVFGLSVSWKNKKVLPEEKSETSVSHADFPDISQKSKMIYEECRPYTLISIERTDAIVNSIDYICNNNIQGDIVECGVWKGGSVYAAIKALVLRKSFDRKIYLFDVFDVEAMFSTENEITEDKNYTGRTTEELITRGEIKKENYNYQIGGVINLLQTTGYPMENIIFKVGRVENTLPCDEIGKIALLRLDTDWYESTKHELKHLFPKVVQKGVLLIDDYGHWQGCKKAVDEYIKENALHMLLHRTDYTGRSAIKFV